MATILRGYLCPFQSPLGFDLVVFGKRVRETREDAIAFTIAPGTLTDVCPRQCYTLHSRLSSGSDDWAPRVMEGCRLTQDCPWKKIGD